MSRSLKSCGRSKARSIVVAFRRTSVRLRAEIHRARSLNFSQLTSFGGPLAGSPRWSPDGKEIAFGFRPEGYANIFVISVDGGHPRRLTAETSADVVPSWSRDGRWIYFCSNRSGERQIWKVPAAGGPAVQVTKHGGFEAVESSDGRVLYYAKGRDLAGIWEVPVEGGEERPIPELQSAGYYRYWAVVDSGIYFVPQIIQPRPVINSFSFATREVNKIIELEKAPLYGPPGLSASANGRWLLYAQIDQTSSDIMLVENFH